MTLYHCGTRSVEEPDWMLEVSQMFIYKSHFSFVVLLIQLTRRNSCLSMLLYTYFYKYVELRG